MVDKITNIYNDSLMPTILSWAIDLVCDDSNIIIIPYDYKIILNYMGLKITKE